jgi:multiple sugar transport system permease protein/raffinose/stachyose/melibiose transport system permease protein
MSGQIQPRRIAGRAGLYFAAIVLAVYSAFPIYWMIVSSLRPTQEMLMNPSLVPQRWTLEYYTSLLAQTDYPRQFLNSLIVAVTTVALTMVLSVMIAYGVTRQRIRGKQMIIAGMLYAYMFPPLLLAIPLYAMFSVVGLNDTLLSLVISHLTITMPLGVWFLWGFFKTMPFELEEAAMVDGCTRLQAFFRIVLPLVFPGLVATSIYALIQSWNEYIMAYVLLSDQQKETLPVWLVSFVSAHGVDYGALMAGATMMALPVVVFFAIIQRHVASGLTAGAVKG